MELDHDGTDNTRHVSQPLPASTAAMDESSRARSDSTPVADEKHPRVVDHDSLVTVRLSEPSYLYVNTNLGPNILPSRKSLYGTSYTPSDVIAAGGKEEQDGVVSLQQEHNESPAQTPTTIISDNARSLREELGEDEESAEDLDSIHSTLDDTDITQQDSNDTSEISHPRSSEETNWDQLQEFEDQESKDQMSENVS
jgi:hypothetical protein